MKASFSLTAALLTSGHAADLAQDLVGAKNRPVTKVVTLLKDMLKTLEKEAEEDQEIYEKMACWCTTNDKQKTKAISDAESRISQLTNKVEEMTALSARLNTEIANLESEVAKNKASLDKATAIREKELAEFNADEKSSLETISALKSAITILSKHNSFLQLPHTRMLRIVAVMQNAMEKHAGALKGVLTLSERKAVAAFIQDPHQQYAPQSGEIFGILRQMKETFEADLSTSQKEELASQKAYEDLKAGKEKEIAAGQSQVDTKSSELADTDEKNAQAKTDIEDTKASLSADAEFLLMLKEKCSMTDSEWEARSKTRALEMEACSKALAVLSGDDAHDLFSRTLSLVQEVESSVSARRNQVSNLLMAASKKFNNPRLATLATKVKLDAFVRVKKAIDDMIAQLLQQKADEIKQKDFCTDELNSNQLQTEKKEREKSDLVAKVEDLDMTIEQLAKAISNLKSEISEMQVQLKRAGEDREKQNKEFQATVADQRATQQLLQKALTILEEFYGKASLLQDPAGPPPPAGFKEYKKNAASGGVMGMIQQIVQDAKAMEAEAIKDEGDAQASYESFVKETNSAIEAKSRDIVNKSEDKSKAEAERVETKVPKESAMVELEELSNYNAELHKSCDFVLKNFDVRQTARDEEVEALKQAKAILSGAKFEQFLQAA